MSFFLKKPNAILDGYRPDIDGLRAFAVLVVIFYHFDMGMFKGGFIGVDVFFVISGYLITRGVSSLIGNDKFDLGNFYARRARRLFPALIATIAVSYLIAFILFSPADFMAMSGATVYALAGISNIYFWMGTGYFDSFSSLKPLLHTWSLGVELQFYLIWPFILVLMLRVSWKTCAIGVAAFTFLAAVISIYYVNVDSASAFFLFPFRMYEFSIGAIVVFVERVSVSNKLKNFIYAVGALMIIIPSLIYDVNKITFPGYFALIPCVGAALMIFSGKGIFLSKIISVRPVNYIGEISYSLYLVHWPIYVFTSYVLVGEISYIIKLSMLLSTAVISILMHKAIETPFRNPKHSRLSGAGFALTCSVLAMSLIVISSSSWANKGWAWRLPEEIRNVNVIDEKDTTGYTWKAHDKLSSKARFDANHNKERVLVLGDSQSADIINMLSASGNIDKYDVVARTVNRECGTPYIIPSDQERYFTKENPYTIKRPEFIDTCKLRMVRVMDENLLKSADKIFISMHYDIFALKYIKTAVQEISAKTNAKIYIFGRKNLSSDSVKIVNDFGRLIGVTRFAIRFKDLHALEINRTLKNTKGSSFIDVMDIVCPSNEECLVLTDDKKPIFFDPAHLTRFGAAFLGGKLFETIRSIDGENS